MEQIVILILFVAGSIVSSIIQNKKKREQEARERHGDAPAPSPLPQRPFERWPQTTAEWQDQLRRLFEQEKTPPPIPPVPKGPPVIVKQPRRLPQPPIVERSEGDEEYVSPLKDSIAAYSRASAVHERVEDRMRSVDKATETHKPRQFPQAVKVAPLTRWTRNPRAVREAFVASLIFSPPVAFDPGGPRSTV